HRFNFYSTNVLSYLAFAGVQNGLSRGLIWIKHIFTFTKIFRMRHLTILVPDGENNLSSIVGAYKIFTRANEHWKNTGSNRNGRKDIFKIELAGISKKVDFYGGLFSVRPHTHIS